MVSFSRVVKEEVVFNDFESCCQRAMLCAVIKSQWDIIAIKSWSFFND